MAWGRICFELVFLRVKNAWVGIVEVGACLLVDIDRETSFIEGSSLICICIVREVQRCSSKLCTIIWWSIVLYSLAEVISVPVCYGAPPHPKAKRTCLVHHVLLLQPLSVQTLNSLKSSIVTGFIRYAEMFIQYTCTLVWYYVVSPSMSLAYGPCSNKFAMVWQIELPWNLLFVQLGTHHRRHILQNALGQSFEPYEVLPLSDGTRPEVAGLTAGGKGRWVLGTCVRYLFQILQQGLLCWTHYHIVWFSVERGSPRCSVMGWGTGLLGQREGAGKGQLPEPLSWLFRWLSDFLVPRTWWRYSCVHYDF